MLTDNSFGKRNSKTPNNVLTIRNGKIETNNLKTTKYN